MKNRNRFFALLLSLVMLVCACGAAAAEEEPAAPLMQSAAEAEEFVRLLLGDTPEVLDSAWRMTNQMRLSLALSGGMKAVAASLASLGKADRIGPAYEGTAGGYAAYFVPCRFAAMPVDLILVLEDGVISGLITGPYTGDREEDAASGAFDSVDLALPVPSMDAELPGTLTLPKGDGPFPAVVLVHGSGPNDRDETILSLKPFRDLAEGLAEKGVAVYRYDKRTYVLGAQMMENHQLTLVDETIEDAAAAVQLLALQPKIDPARIFVLGHSLGGNAVPAIDRALEALPVRACGYILMAASPRPMDTLMREQYDYLFSLMPSVPEDQRAERDRLFAELDKLKDPDALTEEDQIAGAYAPYWLWLMAYDALDEAGRITAPCLLLQGEEDYQVTMEDFRIWQEAFAAKENWRLVSYPGLTHPFTRGLKTEASAAYARAEKVDPQVIGDIADFVLGKTE